MYSVIMYAEITQPRWVGRCSGWGDRRVYIGLIYIIQTRIAYIRTSIRQIKAKRTKVRHGERE